MSASVALPEILAPAGDRGAFLAALAAGADAIYCGLKAYSARMAAGNFTVAELASLIALAHDKNTRVYLAMNTLLKSLDLAPVGQLLRAIVQTCPPDALIFQDLAVADVARQAGFEGELHLSTLANAGFPLALGFARERLGIQRVVIPRELNVDEIKQMAAACPQDVGLEVFVHGALCYGVSGRCYWSSFLGGKSGLRGRCVQPCRRVYRQAEQNGRFFSCRDLWLDTLTSVLLPQPKIVSWKIEGRKKGPHYVYYTVKAYRLLRDMAARPQEVAGSRGQAKKDAQSLLAYALGRPGTHYLFLPQRPFAPVDPADQTGSGMQIGTIKGGGSATYLNPSMALLPGDLLRIGYEDEKGHMTLKVNKWIPKKGRLHVKKKGARAPVSRTPVFLIDRRENDLQQMIAELDHQAGPSDQAWVSSGPLDLRLPQGSRDSGSPMLLRVSRKPERSGNPDGAGLWVDETSFPARLSTAMAKKTWWWLPPAIWPEAESRFQDIIARLLSKGARHFVLNAPWQAAFFKRSANAVLWAGPFCNAANPLTLALLKKAGFSGVIVSPELGRDDILALPGQSPLPLGIVIAGNWPFCVARTLWEGLKPGALFVSPKGEEAWAVHHGGLYWIYPNWCVDLQENRSILEKAGFRMFVHLREPVPRQVTLKSRPGRWNWDLGLT